MNTQSNQTLSFQDVATWVFIIGAIAWVLGFHIRTGYRDKYNDLAWYQARGLALQLSGANGHSGLTTLDELGRTPTSSEKVVPSELRYFGSQGSIGRDPWGNPFIYQVIAKGQGAHPVVVVWSKGPDQNADSQPSAWSDIAMSSRNIFHGDDVGAFVRIDY